MKRLFWKHRSFTQVTLQNHPEWQPFCVNLQEKFYEYIDRYMKDCDVTDMMFPQQFAFEQFTTIYEMMWMNLRTHVDVGNYDSGKVGSWYSFYILMTTIMLDIPPFHNGILQSNQKQVGC